MEPGKLGADFGGSCDLVLSLDLQHDTPIDREEEEAEEEKEEEGKRIMQLSVPWSCLHPMTFLDGFRS